MAVKYNGIEKYIWSDTYNVFLKYKDCPNTEETWENVTNEIEALNQKYHNHSTFRAMSILVLNQLDSRISGRPIDGRTYRQWNIELNHVINA